MNVYVVIATPPADRLGRAITTKYPVRHHTIAPESAWAIGTQEEASADVCSTLGINTGDQFISAVVVKVDQYYGVYDPALWQKMRSWGEL